MSVPSLRPRISGEIEGAATALDRGEPILIYDAPDREGETDLVILSERATPELVRLLRRDAGGLICTAISDELREALGLPFQAELAREASDRYPILRRIGERPRYDRRSAFGITVNHRENYTGISDIERARTIREVGAIASASRRVPAPVLAERFASVITTPGHLPLIYAARGLLSERKGHTELAVSLARMGGLGESATVCEMLGDSGGARSPEAARAYAADHGWIFLEGRSIVEAWRSWSA
ncbi:MAG: 3,4-dihydroxy-2-butanone-4-phosphate synthase [Thermoplasmata archaeon]